MSFLCLAAGIAEFNEQFARLGVEHHRLAVVRSDGGLANAFLVAVKAHAITVIVIAAGKSEQLLDII